MPSGAAVRVEYGATGSEQPVLSVRIQEAFGWTATPRIAEGRVPVLLHLLTPARRPAAVTADLESFWSGPYLQVRAELLRLPDRPCRTKNKMVARAFFIVAARSFSCV